jgi:hypothetical protein
MRIGTSLAAGLVSVGLAASLTTSFAGCSSDESSSDESSSAGSGGGTASTGSGDTGCSANPFVCPAGQTCWPSGPNVKDVTLECLNSGPGQAGDECANTLNQPSCADGLACFAVAGYPVVCTPFCDPKDPAHACPDGGLCVQLTLQGTDASYNVCQPAPSTSGAGGGGTGGSDPSTSGAGGGVGGGGGAGGG